jgi:crotonobetainyl-CoA:carnitine CoA-transferase CaiB-like acyl-CoA transferase
MYRTADAKLVYIKADSKAGAWEGLCRILGLQNLPADERFDRASKRRADMNGPALYEILQRAIMRGGAGLQSGLTQEELIARLEAADIVCAAVQSPEEVVKDPQVGGGGGGGGAQWRLYIGLEALGLDI